MWDIIAGLGGGTVIGFFVKVFMAGRESGERKAYIDGELKRLTDDVIALRADIKRIEDYARTLVTKSDLDRIEARLQAMSESISNRLDQLMNRCVLIHKGD